MRASTLKAVAIHTADEAGASDGPDYQFGWGLLNTESAASLISSVWIDQTEHTMQEQLLTQGSTYTMQITSDGLQPLKVTLCWTDPAGTPVSAQLDPPNIMLVNDLDVRITGNSTTYNPWVLDPANPSTGAATGDNIRDNVEQVYIASPTAGTYTITVNHKGTLESGSQAFSLIMSGANYSDQSLPVTLASFTALPGKNMVALNWVTESEIDNLGFNIYRSDDGKNSFRKIAGYQETADLEGLGSSSIGEKYHYYDFDLDNGMEYWYKIEDESLNGKKGAHEPVSVIPSAQSTLSWESLFPPTEFSLMQNYPNPFNPYTKISYNLANECRVKLKVYNALGNKVAEIVDKRHEAGRYSVSFDGDGLASGVYFYQFTAGRFTQIRKMILLR